MKNKQTVNDLMQEILKVLPTAVFDEDLEGQIVIYTGKQEAPDGSIVEFECE